MNSAQINGQTLQEPQVAYRILLSISLCHLINDTIQSVIPSIYPILKENFSLSFTQIGFVTVAFQLTASILQPFLGFYNDKNPKPKSLPFAMMLSLMGLLMVAFAFNFTSILVAVCIIGIGSAVFHPEAARISYLSSPGKRGLAQSIFQVGGNTGSALGPLITAFIVFPFGQRYLGWLGAIQIIGILILIYVSRWYSHKIRQQNPDSRTNVRRESTISRSKTVFVVGVLLILIFSKFIYMSSMTNYYTFFLIEKFQVSVQDSQFYLFAFLLAVAVGTIIGGPLGDKFGRKLIIWISILGAAPFTCLLPYVGLELTVVLSVVIGLVLSSAFSAIVLYAIDLLPGKIGLISGLFYGFSFGIGAIGSALLGRIADMHGITYMFSICAFLPLIGVIAVFLPKVSVR